MEVPSGAELRRAAKALVLGFALGLVLLVVARHAPGKYTGGANAR
jgi:hypothetical protein